ncbi:MAG: hypothetical protein Q9188_004577 [Gyalolechia gomerana]
MKEFAKQQGLDVPEKALYIASHFQRIATDESTSLGKTFSLIGRISDLRSDDGLKELLGSKSTTVLHDAVRPANYLLVENLLRTRSDVSAIDSEGQLALDVAMKIKSATAKMNSIKALFQQTVHSEKAAKALGPAPPLGWEELAMSDLPFRTSEILMRSASSLRGRVSTLQIGLRWAVSRVRNRYTDLTHSVF